MEEEVGEEEEVVEEEERKNHYSHQLYVMKSCVHDSSATLVDGYQPRNAESA